MFSIVLGAECLSYLKSIETHARAFFKVIIFSISSVFMDGPQFEIGDQFQECLKPLGVGGLPIEI